MTISNVRRSINRVSRLALALCWIAATAYAQSTDIAAPSAVRTYEVSGAIVARDIGDARLTDHYYAFTGTPGDLLITVEGNNLNGDVDVFTAAGLRPLLKFSVYAGSSSPLTKSIFLRRSENLILRIEARTPDDDPGTYRLRFGGSFAPITTAPLIAENESAPVESTTAITNPVKKGRRVSSVGARIEEPPEPEVAAAPTPEPTPAENAVESPAAPEAKPAARAPARSGRGRRLPGRRTRTPQPTTPEDSTVKAETDSKPATEEVTETEPKPAPRGRRSGRRGAVERQPTETPQEPEVETGPRLVIETDDGTLIDRYMSGVRRVIVENGVVVVVGKDGKVQRVALAKVVRMSIAP